MHSAEQPPAVPGLVLGDVLGRGADGPVWSAVDAAGERRAVKVLPVPRHGGLGQEEARLEVAAACFEHAHIVRVHDVVACTLEDRPALALVMERLDGGSLGRVVAERGRLSAGEVVTVIAPIASALAALHARGIVHGDVSPGNVLLAANGKPALADLGVARVVGDSRVEVAGTDGVLAPEVELGGLPSPASDVHALGALAWWCLTGSAPGSALVRRPLAEQVGTVPAGLVEVVEAAASPVPEDRPTALELASSVFDAAPAEPLRITPGGTEATALTRRIRAAHVPVAGAADDPTERGGPAWTRRLRAAWPRHGSGGGPRRRVPAGLPSRGSRPQVAWAPVAVAGAAVVLTVLALLAVPTGILPTRVAAPGAAPGSGPSADAAPVPVSAPPARSHPPAPAPVPSTSVVPSGAVVPSRTVRPGPVVPLLEQPDAPTRDPRGVAGALLAARARLWNAPDLAGSLRPQALAAVHAPASPSRADDARMLGEAQRSGFRYTGVGFAVRSARAVRSGGRVVVSAVVDASAYVVRAEDGASDRRAARTGREVRLVLSRTPAGWRLAELAVGP